MTIKLFEKIYVRFALGLFVIFLLFSSFSSYYVLRFLDAHQQHITQKMHFGLASHVLKEYLLFGRNGQPDINAAKKVFMDLMVLGPNFEFYLLDEKGNIVTCSPPEESLKLKQVNILPIETFVDNSVLNSPIYGDNPRSSNQKKVFTAAPIIQNNSTLGYLYIILGSDIYDDTADLLSHNRTIIWVIIILLTGVIFSFMSSLFLAGYIVGPVCKLANQTKKFCDRGFGKKEQDTSRYASQLSEWSESSTNEIHRLACSFKALLNKLEEQYDQVLTIDELRREFLTHISHDLRTPLASLMGYLETWEINRHSLGDEESARLVSIARRNAEKVANLVEQVFELAHLDSSNVKLALESFSMAELVHDVLQKFELAANEKNIRLYLTPKDSSIIVLGDIEKLERVFDNLIENAIRHTPSGGEVCIELKPRSDSVDICVKDTGVGIPEEDLAFVFDAHFKAGNSVRGNSSHGGIGLAITKRIVELHERSIRVESIQGQGTRFSFSLAMARQS